MEPPESLAAISTDPAMPSPAVAGTRASERKRSLAKNLAWRAIADWSSQIVSWASFLIVVRLLSPSDFGVVAMAAVLLSYLKYAGEFGIPATVVTLRDLTNHQIAQLNTVSVLLGLVSFGVASALAHPIAWFFKTPPTGPVIMVSCLTLIFLALRAVPEGLLEKEFRIETLSLLNAIRGVIAAVATLIMAFKGLGYWALVLGNLIGFAIRSLIVLALRPYPFALPRLASIGKPLRFGWHVLVSFVAWMAYSTLDNVTAGRTLGPMALGYYGMAWNLANVPLEKVTTLVTTVVPSYFAAIQTDAAALRHYVRTLTEGMALATFPPTIGLGLIARELVPVVLGHKWDPAIPALEILSAYAAFRSVVALLSKLLIAVGYARFVMWDDLVGLALLPVAFYAGSHWGISGIAWGWVAAYPFVVLPLYWKTFRVIGMHASEYFRAVRPALDGSLAMVLGVGFLKWALPSTEPMLFKLVVEVATGAVLYVGTVLLLHRQRARVFYNMAVSLRRSKG